MARNPLMLFDPNPPEAEGDVEALFHNRVNELRDAMDKLRAPHLPALPLVVHGPSRSGKSHFARYLVQVAVREGAPFFPILVAAGEKMNARRVLARMYRRLLDTIPQFPPGVKGEEALEGWQRELQEFHEVLPLVDDASKEFELETTRVEAQQRQSRFGFSFGPSVTFKSALPTAGAHTVEPKVDLKLEATRGSDQSRSETHKVKGKVSLPTDEHVVAWIGRLLALRRRIDARTRVLFTVDDLDLLDPRKESGDVCGVLLDLLTELTRTSDCVVIVTVRTRSYNERAKDLPLLAHIRGWSDTGELRRVYDLRVEQLNDGEAVFEPEAVEWLAQRVEGRVGMLLQLCRELSAGAGRPVARQVVLERLREQLDEWRGRAEFYLVIPKVVAAVKQQRMQVEFEEALPACELLPMLLMPEPSVDAPVYRISPLFQGALQ